MKKAMEISQRETAIKNAEELFKDSMMHDVGNKDSQSTEAPATNLNSSDSSTKILPPLITSVKVSEALTAFKSNPTLIDVTNVAVQDSSENIVSYQTNHTSGSMHMSSVVPPACSPMSSVGPQAFSPVSFTCSTVSGINSTSSSMSSVRPVVLPACSPASFTCSSVSGTNQTNHTSGSMPMSSFCPVFPPACSPVPYICNPININSTITVSMNSQMPYNGSCSSSLNNMSVSSVNPAKSSTCSPFPTTTISSAINSSMLETIPPQAPNLISPVNLFNSMCSDTSTVFNLDTSSPLSRPRISSMPTSSTPNSSSFLRAMTTDCGDCILKDSHYASLKEYCSQLERDVKYWRNESLRLQSELEKRKEVNERNEEQPDLSKIALTSNEGHYVPKRGIRINRCAYIMKQEAEPVPEGYVALAEGHQIYVPVRWLTSTQGSFKGKTKSCCLKLMVNGFFQPHEVVGMTGGQLSETPLGQALEAYALTKFSMDGKEVIFALNAKIATMNRALKTMRAPQAQLENTI